MACANHPQGVEIGNNLSSLIQISIDQKNSHTIATCVTAGLENCTVKRRQRFRSLGMPGKMPSLHQFLVTFVLITFLTLAYSSAITKEPVRSLAASIDTIHFQELLADVSDAALHEILLEYVQEKYQDGVFPEDRTAMQVVHQDDAAMATSLVLLAKRANSTGSVGAGSSAVTPGSTSTPDVSVPPTTTPGQSSGPPASTPAPPQTSPATSNAAPTGSGSASVAAPGTTASVGTPQTTGASNPSSDPSTPSNPSSGPSTPSTSVASAKGSSDAGTTVVSTTKQNSAVSGSDSTFITSARSSTTQQIVYTTTLPNGSQSTITSYTVVAAGQQASTPGISASTGSPSLQSEGAPRVGGVTKVFTMLVVLVGVIIAL